ncbi:MAG: YdcF family protein, partial [Spirochaetia bacterium]|nr:YdcF family protein [Spirochaetia bacterium]
MILPFQLFLVLVFVLWKGAPPSRFRRFFALFFVSMVFLSTTWGSSLIIRILEDAYPDKIAETTERADAIIVLSGMVNALAGPGRRPEFLGSLDRILAAEELLRLGKAPKLVISGGSGLLSQAGQPEAEILKRWLVGRGIQAERIITESGSRNTAENARESAAIIRKNGWTK